MKSILLLGAAITSALVGKPASADTLQTVKDRGFLLCGVSTGNPGFSAPDDKGDWKGFDVDLCHAIASAVFGDGSKVKYVPLTSKVRFTALGSGEVDVLARQTTWTSSRESKLGLLFPAIYFYDGQGFMINSKKLPDVKSAKDLSGATVCTLTGTTAELNMSDWFRANKIDFTPLVFEKLEELNAAYDSGRCDVYTDDMSQLYGIRLTLSSPPDHTVLPEVISKEPYSLGVRQGDDKWMNIVKWTNFALIDAEEYGITQANVDEMKGSANPDIKRMLGQEDGTTIGSDLGISNDYVVNIIKDVGNYGEIFDRNIGKDSPVKMSRGTNDLWTKGGLLYAPPIR